MSTPAPTQMLSDCSDPPMNPVLGRLRQGPPGASWPAQQDLVQASLIQHKVEYDGGWYCTSASGRHTHMCAHMHTHTCMHPYMHAPMYTHAPIHA